MAKFLSDSEGYPDMQGVMQETVRALLDIADCSRSAHYKTIDGACQFAPDYNPKDAIAAGANACLLNCYVPGSKFIDKQRGISDCYTNEELLPRGCLACSCRSFAPAAAAGPGEVGYSGVKLGLGYIQ